MPKPNTYNFSCHDVGKGLWIDFEELLYEPPRGSDCCPRKKCEWVPLAIDDASFAIVLRVRLCDGGIVEFAGNILDAEQGMVFIPVDVSLLQPGENRAEIIVEVDGAVCAEFFCDPIILQLKEGV